MKTSKVTRRSEPSTEPSGNEVAETTGDEVTAGEARARARILRRPRRRVADPEARSRYVTIRVLTPLVVIFLWWAVVKIWGIQETLLPSPVSVLDALIDYARAGLWSDSFDTLRVVLIGLLIGTAIGVTAGLLMGWDPRVRAALSPLVAATFPIPKIAFLSLLVIWFGIGDTSRIVMTVIGVFYIILINTLAAVDAVPPVLIMASANLGAGRIAILRKVLLPAALPNIFASLRIAFSISLILVIAAEMQIPSTGVGSFINRSGQILDTRSVFAGLLVTGIFGLSGSYIIDRIERLVMPWKSRH